MPGISDDRAENTELEDSTRYHVPSLERALSILEFLAAEPHGRGVSEIARSLDLPKNSVFRIVTTLHAHGYLYRDPADKTFRVARKLLVLAYSAIDENHLVEESLDVLRQLRDETGETALIGTLGEDRGLVLEQVASNQPVKFLVSIGHAFPLHTAAPGKAMVAFLPPDEREAMLEKIEFVRFTAQTITSKKRFRAELEEIREKGYAVDRGEELDTLHCVAAPVFNHRGRPLASIWITGPSDRLRLEHFERVGKSVAEKALVISKRFGYSLL